MAQKLSEDLAAFRKESEDFQAKVLAFIEAQTKASAGLAAELTKLSEAAHEAAVKAAAKTSKSGNTKKKEEMTVPEKVPDIRTWFINYYINHMEEVNALVPEETMSKVMNVANKKPQAKAGGTPFNKVKADTIYGLVFSSNTDFAKAITVKFEEAHPKVETQAP